VPDCLAAWGDGAAQCETPRSLVYTEGSLEKAAAGLPAGVTLLDTSSYFCTDVVCPVVVGNVRVYLDGGHVTATYMRTVRPLLEADLRTLTGW
jgi:SGNH domain (fused to AT3 domains)